MKDFKEGRIGKGNYDSVAFIWFCKKRQVFWLWVSAGLLFIYWVHSQFWRPKIWSSRWPQCFEGVPVKNQRIRRGNWVSRRFSLVLGSEFWDCSEAGVCLAHEILQLLEMKIQRLVCSACLFWWRRLAGINKGKEEKKKFRFLSFVCSDPSEISLPAASEFLCFRLGIGISGKPRKHGNFKVLRLLGAIRTY
jgi:hypothetical protein